MQSWHTSCMAIWLSSILIMGVCCLPSALAVPNAVPSMPSGPRRALLSESPSAGGPSYSFASTAAAGSWKVATQPVGTRVEQLLAQLTLDEKIGLMANGQAAIKRLGIPQYQFWTECLHGHQERNPAGALPTMFPQPLVLASTFDDTMAWQVFSAISDELRAKSNNDLQKFGEWKYLTCWTPHVNIFRDPRWGRGSETFGEDPYLTSWMAIRVVQGLQGNNKDYTKVVATCKHFLGYSLEGAEGISRYSHNMVLGAQDLADTELPPFKACIQSAGAQGIMCSYNAVNGTPACANGPMLTGLLRDKLGFNGYVVSDCNAITALNWGHKSHPDLASASAAAVNAGVDLFCDRTDEIKTALSSGLLDVKAIDRAVNRSLTIRFITGQFDPPSANPWGALTLKDVNSKQNRLLARQVVQKGAVLLKNSVPAGSSTPLLPLSKAALKKVCVVGPLADSQEHMMGNYYGRFDESATATPLKAIKEELDKTGITIEYTYGMDIMGQIHYDWPLESALQACSGASAGIIFVGSSMVENGLDPNDNSYRPAAEGEGLDRKDLDLPGRQADLVKALATRANGLPLVVVLIHGGGFDVDWMQQLPTVNSILAVGFPGQEGGHGISDILFGRVSPSGRLPITWYRSAYTDKVSPLDLRMRPDPATGHLGRSYRFVSDPAMVLYPFGHGLQYTSFSYSGLRVIPAGQDGCVNGGTAPAACVRLAVTNTGGMASEHVVPLYMAQTAARGTRGYPSQSLRGFKRTQLLQPGETAQVQFLLSQPDFVMPRTDGTNILHIGEWVLSVGTWSASVPAGSGAAAARTPTTTTSNSSSPASSNDVFGGIVASSAVAAGAKAATTTGGGPTADSRVGLAVVYSVTSSS